jgi:hypothetical protein
MTVTAIVPTRPYADAYLHAYSGEHLWYEFDMFLGLAALLGSPRQLVAPTDEDARRLNNGLIESFVIHFRNVFDFLYLELPRPTDVVASDFCVSGAWQPKPSTTLKAAGVRADKEIAHLATSRISGSSPGKGWDFTALADELRPVMLQFVTTAIPSRLSANVAERVRQQGLGDEVM